MAAVAGQPPVAPPPEGGAGGAGGGQSAQLLQQIEQLLMQLGQEQSDPQVQQAVKGMMDQASTLQSVVGQNDAQAMQSGLNNPGGEAGAGLEGSPAEEEGEAPGEEAAEQSAGGGDHGGAEIHVKIAPPKSFGGARKAAMATFGEKGHFDPNTKKGEQPSTAKSKNKAKSAKAKA